MNRFFRTAYSTTLIYLCLTLFTVLGTGVRMPFPAFSCLYFGLLICLLPGVSRKLAGKEKLFYLIGAILAVLGLLPLKLSHCPTAHWVVQFLGIAAAAVFLFILRHRTTHSGFIARYRFSVVLVLILIAFVYFSMLTGIYRDGRDAARTETLRLAINNIVPYAIVLLVTGVLLLRSLRSEDGIVDEQTFNRRQLRDTLIFAVLVNLVFVTDPFVYLKKAIFFLLNDVLQPAASFLIQLLASLLESLSIQRQPVEPLPPPEEMSGPIAVPLIDPTETEPKHYFIEDNNLIRIIACIFIAAAVLVLLVIIALQIRKLILNMNGNSQNRGGGYPSEIREMLPSEEGTDRKRKPKKRSTDPRERIRYMYGEFLKYLKKTEIQFSKTETCREIQDQAEKREIADPSMLSDFTVLYEQARYRLNESPTEDDVRSMKELLDRIRKKP